MRSSPLLQVSSMKTKQDQPALVACLLIEGRREERVENMCAVPGKLTGSHDGSRGGPGRRGQLARHLPLLTGNWGRAGEPLGQDHADKVARIWDLGPEPWARTASQAWRETSDHAEHPAADSPAQPKPLQPHVTTVLPADLNAAGPSQPSFLNLET